MDNSTLTESALGTLILCNHTWAISSEHISPWVFNLLAFTRFSTLFIIFGVYGLALFQRELYFAFLGIGLNIDWILNMILRYSIAEPSPIPNCGPKFAMPCYQCQHTSFLFAIALTFFPLFRVDVRYGAIFLTSILWYWSAFSHYFLNYTTAAQTLVGSFIGFALGILYQLFLRFVLYQYFSTIANSSWNYCGYINDINKDRVQ